MVRLCNIAAEQPMANSQKLKNKKVWTHVFIHSFLELADMSLPFGIILASNDISLYVADQCNEGFLGKTVDVKILLEELAKAPSLGEAKEN